MELEILSFPKDVFLESTFNVDRFLQEHCSKFGLHRLHKELGIYIKYLQSMMIDIVNGESSAIVNLSSDLKILQRKLSHISNPLGQFKEEITHVHKIINVNLDNMKKVLDKKQRLSLLKSSKISESFMLTSSQKISKILTSHVRSNTIDMEILERSVDQYILQQMYSQNCKNEDFKSQTCHSTNVLQHILNELFLKSVQEKNTSRIVRCLQMYILMNTQSTAEQLYRQKILRQPLQDIINDESLANVGGNLSDLYFLIIDFIKKEMNLLLNIVHKTHGITGFNFTLNSAWLEIYHQLELNLSSIYAPGDPALFHQRYMKTCHFLSDFEQCFWNKSERVHFIQHPSYLAHKQLWNLPVYFEIRHLQIVQNLEENLPDTISEEIFNSGQEYKEFRLVPSFLFWKSILRCFETDVYLPELLDRFWKLTLQIITRLITWSRNILQNNVPVNESVVGLSSVASSLKVKFLSYLHSDVTNFKAKLDQPFIEDFSCLSTLSATLKGMLCKCFVEPRKLLTEILVLTEETIVNIVFMECNVHFKQISQIPRLFRKTNRSTPSGPSSYVPLMSKPLDDFYSINKNQLEEDVINRIMRTVHTKIISEYKTLVENVLTSVTKTEESLRRLKKVRAGSTETATVTDDQKIRLQVQLDVFAYCKEAKKFADITCINELLAIIKDAEPVEPK